MAMLSYTVCLLLFYMFHIVCSILFSVILNVFLFYIMQTEVVSYIAL